MRASGRLANTWRISSNTPTYVAGLERGVRPIGILGDVDHLIHQFQALDAVVQAGRGLGAVQLALQGRVKRLGHQAAFTAAADTGNAGEHTQGEAGIDAFQIEQAAP